MQELTIVMYHYVRELRNSRYPNIKGLNTSEFKKQISFFKQRYTFVRIEDIYDAVYYGQSLPKNPIYLTFDDGYLDHYTNVFPILKQNDIEGFFSMPAKILKEREVLDVNKIHLLLACAKENEILDLLYQKLDDYRQAGFEYPSNKELFLEITREKSRFDSDVVIFIKRILQTYLPLSLRRCLTEELFEKFVLKNGRIHKDVIIDEMYLNMDQIRHMAKSGMVFGSHGYGHEWLGNMDIEDMKKDIDASIEFWDGLLGDRIPTICFPYGSYNKEVLQYSAEKGFRLGFSTKVGIAELSEENALTLQRFDTNDFYPKKAS